MAKSPDYEANILSIAGSGLNDLYFLATVRPLPIDPMEVSSFVGKVSYTPAPRWDAVHTVDTWLLQMDRAPGGSLFAVSDEGEIHHNRSGTWEIQDVDCSSGLTAVWACDEKDVFVVGFGGECLRILDASVERWQDPEGRRLYSVHGSAADNVFAVGQDGVVFYYDGSRWRELTPPTNLTLYAVHCVSEREVYVAGVKGVLLLWNGATWSVLDAPAIDIHGLSWYRGDLYVSAAGSGVYVLRGTLLEKTKDLPIHELKTIDDLLFGIGGTLVARFNGTEWRGGKMDLV